MQRIIYSFLLYLAIPLVLSRLLWRGWKHHGYWQRWQERFGFVTAPVGCIWIHAVSVGEFQAAIPLIQQLKQHCRQPIFITTTTVTGSQRVRTVFGDHIYHSYLPYDLPDATTRFLHRVQPSLLILMETELWFNLLHHCQQRQIPVILANARLSERSARGYRNIASITRQMLNCINQIAAQTAQDAQRFIDLGMNPAKVQIIGNIKFEARLPASLAIHAQQLRQSLGNSRPIWIAASTHDAEELQVLTAFAEIKRQLPETLLILVPRHPERFTKVANLCVKSGYSVIKRSDNLPTTVAMDIYLGDTMGELILLYAVSDVAFIGGSLVAVGGHNMLEAAAVGIPIIFGKHIFNFAEIGHNLLTIGAARQVENAAALATVVVDYLQHPEVRHQAGQQGLQFIQHNQGALTRLLDIINTYVPLQRAD